MDLKDKIVVVTGGGNGIGRALGLRFAAEGVGAVVIADIKAEWAHGTAEKIRESGTPALGVGCDVGDPESVRALVDRAFESYGAVDVFCSNAGYTDPAPGDLSQPVEAWRNIVDVNLLAHVWAARCVVPSMIERGGGYLLQTISSAALITGPSAPGYTLSKHGALGFAEWLALNHGHHGIKVSCLCPNAVYTGMFGREPGDGGELPDVGGLGEILSPEQVADQTVSAMTGPEPFLVLPHSRVGESFLRKATDYDAWIGRTGDRLRRMQAARTQTNGA